MAKNIKKPPEKQVFSYTAVSKSGKTVRGKLDAVSATAATVELRRQGFMPKSVSKAYTDSLFSSKKKVVKAADIADFSRKLATMMKAGVPLLQAFDITGDSTENKGMRELCQQIKQDIASGSTFADALKKHPKHFDDLYVSLIGAGEQSGALETMLERIATYKEKSEELKRKVRKAMTYPIAVIGVAMTVIAIIMVFVVPQFEKFFGNFGAELPAITKTVVYASEFLRDWWLAILFFFVVVLFALKSYYQKSRKFRNKLDQAVLKVPLFGAIATEASIGRYARTLSTTFAAGVPLVDALDSVAGAAGNSVFEEAVHNVKEDVSTGIQLNFAMQRTGMFSVLSTSLVTIGEESGALDEMLAKVAEYYEASVEEKIDHMTKLMEPMIMSILGIFVGYILVALYMPIFNIGQAVG